MKRIMKWIGLRLVGLLVAGVEVMAVDSWPPNHSAVYIAAMFPETHPATAKGNKPPDLPAVAACTKLELGAHSGMFTILVDESSAMRWLAKAERDWLPLMQTNKAACEAYVKAHGLPRVLSYTGDVNHGNAFRVVPALKEESQ